MSETALLFDPAELGEVAPPPTPRPSSVRRRLVVVESQPDLFPAKDLAPPVEARDKTHWKQVHRERTDATPLLLPADPSRAPDHHQTTSGECMRRQSKCKYRDCRHHLGGQRWLAEPDDPNTERMYSCVLAVILKHQRPLSPETVAHLLGTTESEVQAIEVYALKAVDRAREKELDGDGGELGKTAAEAFDALADLDNLEPEPPPEYRVVR